MNQKKMAGAGLQRAGHSVVAQIEKRWNFNVASYFSPTLKKRREQRGCAAAAAHWLSAFMAPIGAAISMNACARARRASARARCVSQRKVRASADNTEPFGL